MQHNAEVGRFTKPSIFINTDNVCPARPAKQEYMLILKGGTLHVEPVKMPIGDILDLHTFKPRDVPDLLSDYFAACIEAEIYSVRVIHGKGRGILKKRVQGLLAESPLVDSFKNAPEGAGGWGATLVELKRK